MGIYLLITDRDTARLQQEIKKRLGNETPVWKYPETPDPAVVDMAVVWKHPPGALANFPNLRLISSLGAGVEHLVSDPSLPTGVRLTRIVDEALTVSMRNYVVMGALNIHKRLDHYLSCQQQKLWQKPDPVERPLTIGVLGLGQLGGDIASFLAGMGFEVWGYSQMRKEIPGVQCVSPEETPLESFVEKVNLLVCLLPLTPETTGILRYELLSRMPKGSFLINAARGAHLVEGDLVRLMGEGHIQGAYLDVFREEPLPLDHPFWTLPGVLITPHSASITNQQNAAAIIAENYRRLKTERPLLYEVSASKGY